MKLDWDSIKPPVEEDKKYKMDWSSIRAPIYQYQSKSTPKETNKLFKEQQKKEQLEEQTEKLDLEKLKGYQAQSQPMSPTIVEQPYNPYLDYYTFTEEKLDIQSQQESKKQESKLKDIWDIIKLTAVDMLHNTKQFFRTILPNLIFQDITKEEVKQIEDKYNLPAGSISEETINKINEKNLVKKKQYEELTQRAEDNYHKWLQKHPELQPREEWSKGVLETIKNNPKILLDPAYWAYVAAQSFTFSMAITGTTLATTAITGSPLIGMAAGVAAAYPMQAQDLFNSLVENGATKEQAAKLSAPIGAIIASVEILGDLPLLASISKPFKQLLYKNISDAVAKNVIAKGITTGAKIIGSETAEEIIQEGIQQGTLKTVNENINILKNIPETAVQTFIATFPWAILGIAGEYRQNIQLNNKLQNIKENEILGAKETIVEKPVTKKPAEAIKPTEIGEKISASELQHIEGTGELRTRGLSLSTEARAIERGLINQLGDLPQYNQQIFANQAQKSINLVNNDFDRAVRIAMGEEQPSPNEGLLKNAVYLAVENRAITDGNYLLLHQLATQSARSEEATYMGQEIAYLGYGRDEISPVKAIKEVMQVREKNISEKVKVDIEKEIGRAKEFVNKEMGKISNWESFVNSIRC